LSKFKPITLLEKIKHYYRVGEAHLEYTPNQFLQNKKSSENDLQTINFDWHNFRMTLLRAFLCGRENDSRS